MDGPHLSAAILIISDTAHATPTSDKTIPLLSSVFAEEGDGHWIVEHESIIPDSKSSIKPKVLEWCDGKNPVNLIVTSGGTGFAVKDRTPEVIGPLIDRHAPGLV
jgi:gephyrin